MSEYQYYEFQAIDRPLSPEEQEAVARLSSRVHPHPRRAVFTYSWSGFPGSADEVLARYYDALLYMASWGSTKLMFRFPRAIFDLEGALAYCQPRYVEEFVWFADHDEFPVLNIEFHEEEGGGWIEGEGWLDALLPLRDDILRGDYRALYLAWLKTLEMEDVLDTVVEPPVPPDLARLTPALRRFVELFEIDEDLVAVAAEASGRPEAPSDEGLRQAIAALAQEEKDAFLLRLARGEPHLSLALKQRLRVLGGVPQAAGRGERSVGELLTAAEARRERRRQKQAAEAEARRIAELEALAQREEQTWRRVDELIQETRAKAYDEALRLLVKLRELARYQKQERVFQGRLDRIWELYPRRRALLRRLRQAGLHSSEPG